MSNYNIQPSSAQRESRLSIVSACHRVCWMLYLLFKTSRSYCGYADGAFPSGSVFNIGGPHAMRVVKRSLVDRSGLHALS
jgi:hypothetical protein